MRRLHPREPAGVGRTPIGACSKPRPGIPADPAGPGCTLDDRRIAEGQGLQRRCHRETGGAISGGTVGQRCRRAVANNGGNGGLGRLVRTQPLVILMPHMPGVRRVDNISRLNWVIDRGAKHPLGPPVGHLHNPSARPPTPQQAGDMLDLLGHKRVAQGLVRRLESESIGQGLIPCWHKIPEVDIKEPRILQQEPPGFGDMILVSVAGTSSSTTTARSCDSAG